MNSVYFHNPRTFVNRRKVNRIRFFFAVFGRNDDFKIIRRRLFQIIYRVIYRAGRCAAFRVYAYRVGKIGVFGINDLARRDVFERISPTNVKALYSVVRFADVIGYIGVFRGKIFHSGRRKLSGVRHIKHSYRRRVFFFVTGATCAGATTNEFTVFFRPVAISVSEFRRSFFFFGLFATASRTFTFQNLRIFASRGRFFAPFAESMTERR